MRRGSFLAVLLSAHAALAAGCHGQATLAIVLPSGAVALATTRLTVGLARPGGRAAATDLCADPAAAFEQSIDTKYPVADSELPDLRTGWWAVRAQAFDDGGAVLAEACRAVHVGVFTRRVEILLGEGPGDAGPSDAGDAGDAGGGDAGDGGTDAAGSSDAAGAVLDALDVTVRTFEGPGDAVAGAMVFASDADGDVLSVASDAAGVAAFGPGAALRLPLDVTVRLTLPPAGVDYQQTVLAVSPLGGTLELRVPTPSMAAAPVPAMVTGTVASSAAATTATVTFVDEVAGATGTGNVDGTGTMYDVSVSDAAGVFSAMLREVSGGPVHFAFFGAVPLSPAPAFDLGAMGVFADDATITVSASSIPAAFDAPAVTELWAVAERGAFYLDGATGAPGGVGLPVFDPANPRVPAGTRLRFLVRAGSAATVAACAGAPALEGVSLTEIGALPSPPSVDFVLADPPVAVTPSETAPAYATFAVGAPIAWTPPPAPAPAPLATVADVSFTRANGTPARLVLVAPPGATSGAVPDPGAVGTTLTEDDGAGYCLVLSHVVWSGSFDGSGGLAAAIAAGHPPASGAALVATRRLAFTR